MGNKQRSNIFRDSAKKSWNLDNAVLDEVVEPLAAAYWRTAFGYCM